MPLTFDRARKLAAAFAIVAATLLFAQVGRAAPQVETFTPTGEARGVRQVTARFTEPVVAFGDPRVADPFTVSCDGDAARLKGRGRWADTRNWAYDFESDLPAGQRCVFTLRADLKAIDGQPITGAREFRFHTGGPAVMASWPREGSSSVDEEQVFLFALDASPDPASLNNAWCEAAGINERIALKMLPDKDAREILAANRSLAFNLFRVYFKTRGGLDSERFKVEDARFRDFPIVGVRCSRRLPAGADVAVVLGEAVKTKTGIARSIPQRLAFKVRPAFSVKLSCQRANKDAACMPVTPIVLDFNAPVPRDAASAIRLKGEGGKTYEPNLEADVKTVDSVKFKGPFPEKARLTVELPRNFRDDAGREPENKSSFPLATGTDENPPLAKFPGRFGILEVNAQPLLPVTVRSVEAVLRGHKVELAASPDKGTARTPDKPIAGRTQRIGDDEVRILQRYRSFMHREREEVQLSNGNMRSAREGELSSIEKGEASTPFELPRTGGEQPFEVIGIPLPKPGFYVVELASPRLGRFLHGEDKPYYAATSVLVTNLAVHLKRGRENSIVWVTTLDGGKPVPGARVTVRDCRGHQWFSGKTDAAGIAHAGDKLPTPQDSPSCSGHGNDDLYVFARLGEDLSFTDSSWNEGLEPWNFNLRGENYVRSAFAIHTIFDRTLFRAGETVSMKHIARKPSGNGFGIPPRVKMPRALEIEHIGSGQKFKLATQFDAGGVAIGTWKIPPEAKLGTYEIGWSSDEIRSSAQFRVEAFRVPLMRGMLAPPKEPLIKATSAKMDVAVNYLSGGPASGIPVKVRSRVEPRIVAFPDYSDFRFGGQRVKEGVQSGAVADRWDAEDPDEESRGDSDQPSGSTATKAVALDRAGTAAVTIDKLPALDRPASLLVEMEYSDPNGEILTASTRAPLHPAGIYVGIKPEGWAANKKAVRVQVITLDVAGKPSAGRAVNVDVYERKTYSSRRRLLGGFYAYDSTSETKRAGGGCGGTSDARGLVFCTLKPSVSGELILLARAKDDAGRDAYSTASVWVRGADEWWFEPTNHDRIDLIAEKKSYEPGETAKLQVRMPFREATVLVTVEREGVLAQHVVTLDGKSPVIDVPIAGNYGPNVFISALVVRGRVDPEVPGPYAWLKRIVYRIGYWLGLVDEIPVERDTRPTALIDLSKPAFKLGTTLIKVGQREYALNVKLTPDREVFRVRETARVAIQVSAVDGTPAANGEIALAAVDEGLLELMDNASWNVLDGLLVPRPIEVLTSTAQSQVIGKRHFGKKALPPGGGGGRVGARELFDTLLLWKARVPLDAQGRAVVEVPLNDSLTAFKIVAIAHAGTAKFGHGATSVRTTQDLMLFSGLPPVIREQDEFSAMFTLRNTTAQPLTAQFAWALRDRAASDAQGKAIANGTQDVALGAGEAKVVTVPVKTPINIERLHWEVSASTKEGARDRLRTAQKVIEVHPVRVYQATLAQLDKRVEYPVERPADAVAGRGGVRVEVMGTLAGELSGVREFFVKYPYTCLEQRASKAIGLNDEDLWKSVAGGLANYLDADGLARYFPSDLLQGSDALTTYLVQIAAESGREWPEEALERMLTGLDGFVSGRIVRGSALPTADLTVRKLAAIEALSRHARAKGAMLDSIAIDPQLWPTSALIDWIGVLKRVNDVPRRDERLKEAFSLLRGRINFQGTVMTFSTERNDALWWLMISPDVNANRALLAVMDDPRWREDIGRLVRGSLSRQKRGHWGTTIANAWGTVAIARFTQAFEKVAASGNTTAMLGANSQALKVTPARQTYDFEWPTARETLGLAHTGAGAPWAIVQSRAAVPLKAPLSSGYSIRRTVAPVEQKDASGYSRGDVYRVTLEIDAQSDMTWVVIDDPIPSGAQILGSGLGRDAGSLARGEKREGFAWPAFIERTHEAYRAYYELVPKGRIKLEYTVRLNNPGSFQLPATRVEALYAPEMFGEAPNAIVAVKP